MSRKVGGPEVRKAILFQVSQHFKNIVLMIPGNEVIAIGGDSICDCGIDEVSRISTGLSLSV